MLRFCAGLRWRHPEVLDALATVLPHVAACLGDDSEEVRCGACELFVACGRVPPPALAQLTQCLLDESELVALSAARALETIERVDLVRSAAQANLKEETMDAHMRGLLLLSMCDVVEAEVLDCLRSDACVVREEAAWLAGVRGVKTRAIRDALGRLAEDDKCPLVRVAARYSIGKLGK